MPLFKRLGPRDSQDLLLLGLLVLASLPHLFWMPVWVSLSCAVLWLGVFLVTGLRIAKPGRLIRFSLLAAILTTVLLFFGRTIGREAGTAMLLLLLPVKLLEAESLRDRGIALFMGLFLLFASVLFSQTLLTGLYLFMAFWVFTTALIVLCHPGQRLRGPLRISGVLILQGLPLALILFLLFPRLHSGLLGMTRDQGAAMTGLSRTMAPGSISSLARSEKVAFRAEFNGPSPPPDRLYWRAVILRDFDGLRWREGHPCSGASPSLRTWSEEKEYTVTLEPTGNEIMVALDLPLPDPETDELRPGFLLRSGEAVDQTRRYSMRSVLDYRTAKLSRSELSPCLEVQAGNNPRARKLLARLAGSQASPQDLLERLLDYFRSRKFSYSLSPPKLKQPHPIDDFLFRTREGYCEHYAQAVAWMLRAAGVPARIVAGYQGGELNPVGGYFIIRQAQAHAWVEAYFQTMGWTRIDPTRSIDPSRVEPGLQVPAAGTSRPGLSGSNPWQWSRRLWRQAGLVWDGINHAWKTWFLGYTQSRQISLLKRIGLGSDLGKAVGRIILVGLSAVLAFLSVLMLVLLRPKPERLEPCLKAYRRFLKKLERSGTARRPDEGPLDFADRASALHPGVEGEVRDITGLYIRLRYRGEGGNELSRRLAWKVRRFNPGRRMFHSEPDHSSLQDAHN